MSRYRQTMREALEQVYKKEDNDHEISMARGELEAIADKATQLAGALQGKSDEGNPLEAWVQSKITKAKDYINSVSDYMMYKPENAKEEVELEEKNTDKYVWSDINTAMMRAGFSPGMIMKVLSGLRGKELSEELEEAKIISDISGVSINKLKQEVMPFSVNEKTYGWTLVSKAKDLAKKFANNITKAVDEIEKLEKGLSKNPSVEVELRKYNEETNMDEGKMSKIDMLVKQGKSSDEIAKLMNISVSTVKDILGEEKEELKKEDDKDNKENEIQSLKSQVAMLKQKLENEKNKAIKPEPNPETGEVPLTIGIAHAEFKKKKEEVKEENLEELSKAERDKRIQRAKDMIKYYDAQKKAALKGPNKALAKKMLKNETELEEVTQKEIDKFHTDLDNLVHKTFGHSSKEKEKMDEKVADSIIKDLQKAYAPMKGKRISPEMANKISKHLDQPSYDLNVLRQLKKADIPFISTIARNKIYKKTGKFEDRRLYVEAVAGLQKKADKSGMPYSILKKVYDRGMAAWKSGHRPGASQQQWAFARVNSFITKSSGTWGGADKDLAAKVKGK